MPYSFLSQWLRDSQNNLQELLSSDRRQIAAWTKIRSDNERVRYIRAIKSQNWRKLKKAARAELEARNNDRSEMRRRQRRLKTALLDAPNVKTVHKLVEDDFPDLRLTTARRKALTKFFKASGRKPSEIKKILEHSRNIDTSNIVSHYNDALAGAVRRLTDHYHRLEGSSIGAALALAVAEFNSVELKDEFKPTRSRISKDCDRVRDELTAVEKQLHRSLAKEDLFRVWAHASALADTGIRVLFTTLIPYGAYLATRRESKRTNHTLGDLSRECGELIRASLRAYTLGRELAWLAHWPKDAGPIQQWIRKAQALKFSDKIPQGAKRSIRTLARSPGRYDGEDVSIVGVLNNLEIRHRGRKVISTADVVDDKGHTVKVVLPYIKLDSAGLVSRSYVRISGTWHEDSNEAHAPALHIDRLSYTQLSKKSWNHWATLQISSLYQAVPHGLAASWSWQRGAEGPGNQLRYGTWYSRT